MDANVKAHPRMFALMIASQIASASVVSFLCRLRDADRASASPVIPAMWRRRDDRVAVGTGTVSVVPGRRTFAETKDVFKECADCPTIICDPGHAARRRCYLLA